jgi:hypothetical protein
VGKQQGERTRNIEREDDDDAQFTFRAPEIQIVQQPINLAATAWKKRMIDIYINVGGAELTRLGAL